MQKQIETLRAELGNYKTELEASLLDNEQIEVDLENVYRALEDANDRQEERLMEAIAKERQQLKTLEAQVDEAKIHEKEGEALVSARPDPNPFAFLTSSLLSSNPQNNAGHVVKRIFFDGLGLCRHDGPA